MNFIDKLLLLTFPFMDVGFILFGAPFRIGELTFFLFFLRLIDIETIQKISKIHKIGFFILTFMLLNLILTISVTSFSEVDKIFYQKYILRNTLYFFAMSTFIIKPIAFNHIKVESFIKYIIYVVVIFYMIELINFYFVEFGWDSIFVSRQQKIVFHDFLIRFSGPSSEGAYIVPLLSIPLMYGFLKRKIVYSLVSVFLILLTFSSFGYAVILFSGAFFIKNIESKEIKLKAKRILTKVSVFMLLIGIVFANKVSTLLLYNWTKIQAYFGIGDVYEWSASQRAGHIKLAFNLFMDSSWIHMLIGNGTGYYNKMSKAFKDYYLDDAEEAHNLYFSTLTDRGLLGLILLIALFYYISKIKIPNYVRDDYKYFFLAIKFAVFVRMFHWVFTGMLWQYYFWVEVALLISASAYYIKISYDKK